MTQQSSGVREHASVLHALVSASPDHFYLYDRAGKHVYASPAAAQALGTKQEEFVGKTWQEMGYSSDVTERFDIERKKVFETGGSWRGEMDFPTIAGQANSAHEYVLSPVRADDGSVESVLVTARDITERKHIEETLQFRALHDVLTGLANRTLLEDRLEQRILAGQRADDPFSVLFLDLDNFKEVNDTFGHHVGDLLLKQLSDRWRAVLRASDTLSRLGGDEFIALLLSADGTGASETAQRLEVETKKAFVIEGCPIQISVSVGVAVHKHGEVVADAIIHEADLAMYRVKQGKFGPEHRTTHASA